MAENTSVAELTRAIQAVDLAQRQSNGQVAVVEVPAAPAAPSFTPDPPSFLTKLRYGVRRRPTKVVMPRPVMLGRIESRYEAHLVNAMNMLQHEVVNSVLPHFEKWRDAVAARHPVLTDDRADDEYDLISALFDKIRVGLFERETAVSAAARIAAQQAAASINGENVNSIRPVLERVLSVDPFVNEPWLLPMSRNWVTENVSLIRSIGQQYLADVEKLIYSMVRDGKSIADVRAALMKKFGSTHSRARLIARDQVNKYNGQLTRARQMHLNISEYTWKTVEDQRVRGKEQDGIGGKYPNAVPAHTIMEGVICRWDDPTVYWNGKKWVPRTALMPKAHPGEEIQCRCMGLPRLPDWMVT